MSLKEGILSVVYNGGNLLGKHTRGLKLEVLIPITRNHFPFLRGEGKRYNVLLD